MLDIDREFIRRHLNDDPARLRLSFCGRKGIDKAERDRTEASILQIECRKKYLHKFRGLFDSVPDFIFPSVLAAEQASHFWVSRLHSMLIARRLHELPDSTFDLFDMTAGLGVDFLCCAKAFGNEGASSIAAEIDPLKAVALRHNLNAGLLSEASVENRDSLQLLNDMSSGAVKVIFADPARRGDGDRRLYNPADCLPDVVGHWEELLAKGSIVMIKNSPMLDISQALRIFPGTIRLIVISVRNECKEVLVMARRDGEFEGLDAINIIDGEEITSLPDDSESTPHMQFSHIPASYRNDEKGSISYAESSAWMEKAILDSDSPLYLYEPNASLMKCTPWHWITDQYRDMVKASPNCHLFLSTTLYNDFPGRIHRIERTVGRHDLPKGERLNIVSRNHPLSTEAIAGKFRVRSGGTRFLYGLTVGRSEQPVLVLSMPIS